MLTLCADLLESILCLFRFTTAFLKSSYLRTSEPFPGFESDSSGGQDTKRHDTSAHEVIKWRMIHGRADIGNFSSSVQLDIFLERTLIVDEGDIELNTSV